MKYSIVAVTGRDSGKVGAGVVHLAVSAGKREPPGDFSPAAEKEFSSDLQVLYARRRYTRQSFSTRKTGISGFKPRG